jgi:hypothetical protein
MIEMEISIYLQTIGDSAEDLSEFGEKLDTTKPWSLCIF